MSRIQQLYPYRTPSDTDQALKAQMLEACEHDRALLMASQPFTAMLALQLNLIPVVDSRLPTAGTDGKSIFFNARFMAGRTAQDRRFIIAHEVWHCALGHMRRQLGRDHDLWNQACDYEVNDLLRAELGHCPRDALQDHRFLGLSAEEIYQWLRDNAPLTQQGQGVIDEHDLASLMDKLGQDSVLDPDFTPHQPESNTQRDADNEAWRQRLVAVAQQRERMAGNLPGHIRRVVDRIRHPTIPWRQLLARFLQKQGGGERQWLPPSRRHIHRGLYLPSRQNSILELTVAVDNSGSCLSAIPAFMSELRGMLAAFNRVSLTILVFDTVIQQTLSLCENDLYRLNTLELLGGGGTDFEPVFSTLRDQPPSALIVLTDGFAPAPNKAPGFPVLWALTPDGEKPTPWGEALRIAHGANNEGV
ncbi:DUF2201 family putative metallopeptidase [Marinobacter sp.]|uniref:vWA domain-containing protein n=1 Tax=Marinobacter sp. TaxID=50741 RepID=UPI003A8E1FC2